MIRTTLLPALFLTALCLAPARAEETAPRRDDRPHAYAADDTAGSVRPATEDDALDKETLAVGVAEDRLKEMAGGFLDGTGKFRIRWLAQQLGVSVGEDSKESAAVVLAKRLGIPTYQRIGGGLFPFSADALLSAVEKAVYAQSKSPRTAQLAQRKFVIHQLITDHPWDPDDLPEVGKGDDEKDLALLVARYRVRRNLLLDGGLRRDSALNGGLTLPPTFPGFHLNSGPPLPSLPSMGGFERKLRRYQKTGPAGFAEPDPSYHPQAE